MKVDHSFKSSAVSCNPRPFHDTWKKISHSLNAHNKISLLTIHIHLANMVYIEQEESHKFTIIFPRKNVLAMELPLGERKGRDAERV